MSSDTAIITEESVKPDQIFLSREEAALITRNVENKLIFRNSKDAGVVSGAFKAYSTVVASKIASKFGIKATVGDGLKTTTRNTIIFMKCSHNTPIVVSIPLKDSTEGQPMVFTIKQKVRCSSCPESKF